MSSSVEAARERVRAACAIAVLTGAGVSAESGIPTFRSNGGYWQEYRFEDSRPRRLSRAIQNLSGSGTRSVGAPFPPHVRMRVTMRSSRWSAACRASP